jgi:hypothetical protein
MNKEALVYFEGRSQNGGRAELTENLRAFKKVLSNEVIELLKTEHWHS